jgi:hypothetical protein
MMRVKVSDEGVVKAVIGISDEFKGVGWL